MPQQITTEAAADSAAAAKAPNSEGPGQAVVTGNRFENRFTAQSTSVVPLTDSRYGR